MVSIQNLNGDRLRTCSFDLAVLIYSSVYRRLCLVRTASQLQDLPLSADEVLIRCDADDLGRSLKLRGARIANWLEPRNHTGLYFCRLSSMSKVVAQCDPKCNVTQIARCIRHFKHLKTWALHRQSRLDVDSNVKLACEHAEHRPLLSCVCRQLLQCWITSQKTCYTKFWTIFR